MTKFKSARFTSVCLIAVGAISIAIPTNAKERSPVYPKQLLGTWEMGYEPCKAPGNPDSDGRILIEERVHFGYEDSSTPVRILQISRSPLAWKISSLLDIDGYVSTQHEIYVLSGTHLTIVGTESSNIYTRCD